LKHSSNSQKSRGGSIDLAAKSFDGLESFRRRAAAPELGVFARGRRVVQRANSDPSLQHGRLAVYVDER
jgi:hypothetical protein